MCLNSRRLGSAVIVILAIALPGCGGEARVPVSGKVFLGNRLLERGTVVFHPESASAEPRGDLPAGDIFEDGTYQLYTHYQRGAPPGRYRVVVSAYEANTPVGQVPRYLVPPKYMDTKTSALVVEVG